MQYYQSIVGLLVCLTWCALNGVTSANQNHRKGGNSGHNTALNASTAHYNDVINDWEQDLPTVNVGQDYLSSAEKGLGGLDPEEQEVAPYSMATHADMELVLAEVSAVSRQITSLRTQVGNLKYQNHVMYKQLKKVNNRCQYLGTEPAVPKRQCPSEYTYNPHLNSCYKFVVDRVPWRMARERCLRDKADLVSIESAKEQRFIVEKAQNDQVLRHCDFWTGGTDRDSEGQWRWTANGRPVVYSNWNINEPNNGNYDEHCLHMLWVFNWAWNDARCSVDNACFVCEIDKDDVEQDDGTANISPSKGRSGRGTGRRGGRRNT